ncbi:thiamine diphosphokinase [Paenibacillus sp. FJAT-26967]|uniref:thiamine diphosphokinase n=1 Tax=Paenibacillus sp. FJAT-26967 TaxID=1729690 RepID=UPI000837CCD2|nr:thiamine diphosphokinase [Paenibacillus sp. FJAT-26967]
MGIHLNVCPEGAARVSQKQHVVIVTGGSIGPWAHDQLEGLDPSCDYLIGADRGALHLIRGGYRPQLALGDFDSVTPEEREEIRAGSEQFITCDAVDKDWTDTELAYNMALERSPSQITLLGALGTRMDHTLANIHLLRKGTESGVRSRIMDAHNEIEVISRTTEILSGSYPNVSLLPLTTEVTGITLTGFRYPLNDATLTIGQSLGISNVLETERGIIQIRSGLLLVIRSRD